MKSWALHPADAKQLAAFGFPEQEARRLVDDHNAKVAYMLSQPPARPASPARVPSNPTSSRPTKSGRTAGNGPADGVVTVKQAKKLAKQRARKVVKAIGKLALSAGETPERVRLMSTASAELQVLWLRQLLPEDSRTLTLAADDRERAMMMAGDDVDPELRRMFLSQMAPEPERARGPMGMDPDRLALHTEAQTLAQARCDANPRLDPAKTYALAAIEIAEQRNPSSPI